MQLPNIVLYLIPRAFYMQRQSLQQGEDRRKCDKHLALLVLKRLQCLRLGLIKLSQESAGATRERERVRINCQTIYIM